MKLQYGLSLSALLVVGYVTYAMQQDVGSLPPEEESLKFESIQTINGNFESLEFTPRGDLITSNNVSNNKTVQYWSRGNNGDLRLSQDIFRYDGPVSNPLSTAVSLNTDIIAVYDMNKNINMYSKSRNNTYVISQMLPYAIAMAVPRIVLSKDGAYIGIVTNESVTLWVRSSNQGFIKVQDLVMETSTVPLMNINNRWESVVFSSTNSFICAADINGAAKVWFRDNEGTFKERQKIKLETPEGYGIGKVVVSSDDQFIIFALGKHLGIWRKESLSNEFERFQNIHNNASTHSIYKDPILASKPNQNSCFAWADNTGINIWALNKNSNTFTQVATIAVSGVQEIAMSSQNQIAAIVGGNIQIWSMSQPSRARGPESIKRRHAPKDMHKEWQRKRLQ